MTRRRALPKLARMRLGMENDPDLTLRDARSLVVETAYHEAAHVVVGVRRLRVFPDFVTVERGPSSQERSPLHPADSKMFGFVRRSKHVGMKPMGELRSLRGKQRAAYARLVDNFVMESLAGLQTEAVRAGDTYVDALADCDEAPESDLGSAVRVLGGLFPIRDECWTRLLDLAEKTHEYVQKPGVAAAIETVAEALLNHGTLNRGELRRLLLSTTKHSARNKNAVESRVRASRPRVAVR